MKESVKIAIVAAIAVGLFCLIVLGRYLYSEINRLKVGEPMVVEETTSTSTDIQAPTSSVPIIATSAKEGVYKSDDDWTVFELRDGNELENPFIFYGTTTAFENNINWRLSDENGVTISEGFSYVNSPDIGIPGPFEVKAFFDLIPATQTGTLEVFEISARDGSEIHKASAKVSFTDKSQTIRLYFGNISKAPEGDECEAVYPVERMVVGGDDMEIAMHELLKGPSLLEENSEYYTSLPNNVPDPKVFYKKDSVHLEFTEALEYQVGGSCRVLAIRKQIEETAKDASGEEEITISIDGRTEDILQP